MTPYKVAFLDCQLLRSCPKIPGMIPCVQKTIEARGHLALEQRSLRGPLNPGATRSAGGLSRLFTAPKGVNKAR